MQNRWRVAVGVVAAVAVAAGCSAPVGSLSGGSPERVSNADAASLAPSPQLSEPGPQPSQSQPPPTVRIAFGGDSYAEGPLEWRLANDPDGFVGPFARIFRRSDLAMVNLETAITTAGTPEPKAFTFATTRDVLPALRSAGIDVVSMANNHGMDFGWPGFTDSLAAKRWSDSPAVIGIGKDEEEAYEPWIAEASGQRIAFFTATRVLDDHLAAKWTAGPAKGGLASAYRLDYLTERIAQTRPEVDTVVVYLHWGIERYTCPVESQVDLAKALKRAGADIIVGGHQHRLSGGGMMGDAFVHYGLGNFLFQAASEGAERTGVLTVDVQGRDIVGYQWHPGRIYNAVPQKLTGADRDAEAAYWESLRSCTGLKP